MYFKQDKNSLDETNNGSKFKWTKKLSSNEQNNSLNEEKYNSNDC